MKEFFHDGRRKAGVVTLAVACLAATGMMRSFLVRDELRISIRGDLHLICADRGGFCWTTLHEYRAYLPPGEYLRSSWIARPLETPDDDTEYDSHWGWFKFGPMGWTFMLPLTLLSAYLLLWKPRKRPSPN